jgi:hypothetical protein
MIFAAGKERMRCVTTPWEDESMAARSAIADKAAVSVIRNMPVGAAGAARFADTLAQDVVARAGLS